MSLLEMLQKRHSIRKYTDANISVQDLQTILQAGLLSASCCAGVTPESHEAALLTMKMCQIDVINE